MLMHALRRTTTAPPRSQPSPALQLYTCALMRAPRCSGTGATTGHRSCLPDNMLLKPHPHTTQTTMWTSASAATATPLWRLEMILPLIHALRRPATNRHGACISGPQADGEVWRGILRPHAPGLSALLSTEPTSFTTVRQLVWHGTGGSGTSRQLACMHHHALSGERPALSGPCTASCARRRDTTGPLLEPCFIFHKKGTVAGTCHAAAPQIQTAANA